MAPQQLTEADVRRIVRDELRAMGFGESRLRELVSEEFAHALRRHDERARWLEERRVTEVFGPKPADPSPRADGVPRAATYGGEQSPSPPTAAGHSRPRGSAGSTSCRPLAIADRLLAQSPEETSR